MINSPANGNGGSKSIGYGHRTTIKIILIILTIGMTMSLLSFGWELFQRHSYCPYPRDHVPNIPSPPASRMIVVSRYKEDVSWLPTYFGNTPFIVYNRDDQRATNYVPNVGNEALAYLDFIIHHYDNLPNATAFVHGDRHSWHTTDIVPILRYLKWNAPYASLNYDRFSTFWHTNPAWTHFAAVWPHLFQDTFGDIPSKINRYCCAQFVVSRERILLRSRAFYQRLYDWLRTTRLPSEWSGRVLEHSWGFIFGDGYEPHRPHRSECLVMRCEWWDYEQENQHDHDALVAVDKALSQHS